MIDSGATEIDEALLTGESRSMVRVAGDEVIAGTINLSQPVEVTVTAAGQETTVSGLGRLLLMAQSRRKTSSGLPGWLVPAFIVAVLFIAGFTWIAWQSIDPAQAFPAMLSVLVASCPCALSLALPVVQAAASRRVLDEGSLRTNSESLVALNRITAAVFDKTGTLTQGVPEIVDIDVNPASGMTEHDCLLLAGALETASAHPIAHAFLSRLGSRPGAAGEVKIFPAQGLRGIVEGNSWNIGTAQFATGGAANDPGGSIWLGDGSDWVARFHLRDSIREGSERTVRKLAESGVGTAILSGDAEEAVAEVAARLGIREWSSRQSPEMKLHYLERRKAQGDCVLMVGDGVNDAPVLAAADVSMTVKGGAELANSTADMILTADSLDLVLNARHIAVRTRQLIRQNLTWAVLYNASVMPLAVSGSLKPWMAALGLWLSSLMEVAFAARLVCEKQSNK